MLGISARKKIQLEKSSSSRNTSCLSTDRTPSQRTKRRLRAEHDLTKVTGERVGSSFALTFEVRTTVLPLSFCPSERLNSRMKPSSVPTYKVEPLNSRVDICIEFTLTS